jgi:hypothetical protein
MKFIKAAVISLLLLSVFSGCKEKSWKYYINNNSNEKARVVFYHHKIDEEINKIDKEVILNSDETAQIGTFSGDDLHTLSWNYVKVFLDDELAYECVLDSMDSHSILNVEYYYSRHPKAKGDNEVADLFRWCGDVLCENQCYSDPPEVDPETGEEGGACYGNGTCNEGLLCEKDICVKDPETDDDSSENSDDEADEPGDDDSADECDIDYRVFMTQKDIESIVHCKHITGELLIEGSNIEEIKLPKLESVEGGIEISDNSKLKIFSAPKLNWIGWEIFIFENPMLEELELENLVDTGSIVIGMNASLKSLTLPQFMECSGGVFVMFNDSLESIDVSVLDTVNDDIFIYKNASLKSFSFPKLLYIGLQLLVARNNVLETFDLYWLRNAQYVAIAYNPQLPTELAEAVIEKIKENDEEFEKYDYEVCENKDSTVKCYDDYEWEWEEDWGDDDSGCISDTYQCSGNILHKCEDGIWKYVENCGETGLTCDIEKRKCV